jgi:hypothetical protein
MKTDCFGIWFYSSKRSTFLLLLSQTTRFRPTFHTLQWVHINHLSLIYIKRHEISTSIASVRRTHVTVVEVGTTRSGPQTQMVSESPPYVGQDFSFLHGQKPFPALSLPQRTSHSDNCFPTGIKRPKSEATTSLH